MTRPAPRTCLILLASLTGCVAPVDDVVVERAASALVVDETAHCGPIAPEHAARVVITPVHGVPVHTAGFDVVPHEDPGCRLDVDSVDRAIDLAIARWESRGYPRAGILDAVSRMDAVRMLETIPQPDAVARTIITWSGTQDDYHYTVEIPLNPIVYGGPYPVFCTTFQHELDHAFAWGLNRAIHGHVGHTVDISGNPASSEELAAGVPPYGTWCGEAAPSPPDHVALHWGLDGDVPLAGDPLGHGHDMAAVYRPSEGILYAVSAVDGASVGLRWGLAEDHPFLADFFGAGRDQLAQWRPSDGTWYALDAVDGDTAFVPFGQAGDRPFVGDVLGLGRAAAAVYRPADGTVWAVDLRDPGAHRGAGLAAGPDATPIAGDFLGRGHDQVALFDAGRWVVHDLVDGDTREVAYGAAGDVPLAFPATDRPNEALAVYRPSEGVTYRLDLATGETSALHWGAAADRPVVGDLLGEGTAQLAQFRPSDGVWWIRR